MRLEDLTGKFKELYDQYGEECISGFSRNDFNFKRDCWGKPCACLVCRHVDNICVHHESGSGCSLCGGEDKDRTYEFCLSDEEEFYEELD